eukprot:6490597-Amphidinium_carterae.2
MRDVIIEGSKPGCFKNTLIQAGMERGSAVGTAGVKLETAEGDDNFVNEKDHKIYRSVCGRLPFASPRRPDLLFTLKELGRGLAKPKKSHWQLMKHLMRYLRGSSETVLVHVPGRAMKGILGFRLGRMPEHTPKHQLWNDMVGRSSYHFIRQDAEYHRSYLSS